MTPTEQETGDAILTAAAELIGERGYKGTTTRVIAERAGVNEVTVFRRFGSKQGILRALAESWAAGMAGFAVSAIPDPADTRATLEALAVVEVRQATEIGAAALRLAIDARSIPEVTEVMGGGTSRNLDGLADYLTARQGAGDLRADLDPRVMAEAFFTMTSTFVMAREIVGGDQGAYDLPLDEVARQMVEIYWAGVKSREASE
jgi:AcrR family transcriptional regulator